MKKLLLALVACFGLSGCMLEGDYYPAPYGPYNSGEVEFCDDYGCRWIDSSYYYDSSGVLFYWDTHFGVWVGPHGYYRGGAFYPGFYPGYHGWYRGGYYHGYRGGYYHGGGGHYYHGGGGYRGGYHGGGFHGGGGGHHR